MASQPDFGLLGNISQSANGYEAVQRALFNGQQQQQNQNVLDQQARADQARQLEGQIVANPHADDATFEQMLKPLATVDPQRAMDLRNARIAYQKQQELQSDFGAIAKDPSARNVATFMMKYPQFHEGISKGWDVLSGAQRDSGIKTAADVKGLLDAGNGDAAIQVLQGRMEADKAAGVDTSSYPQLISLIRDNPNGAKALANITLAAAMGPDKFADAYGKIGEEERANEKQPYVIQQAAADASKATTEAEYAPQVTEANLAKTREDIRASVDGSAVKWAQLNLDKDKLTTETQLRLEQMHQQAGQLDASANQAINSAVISSQTNQALADRAKNLADQFQATDMSSGWMASANSAWKGAFGSQDAVSGLRQAYQSLINSQAVKNLPPGPASDKDIALAKQGFPPPTASKEYIVSFLRGMEKMQTAAAQADDRRANWIAANKSLAPARQDINVGGVLIPAGTTFREFNQNVAKTNGGGEKSPWLDAIFKKYGGPVDCR